MGLSADGRIIVLGDSSFGNNEGRVRVYQWNETMWDWEQLGPDITSDRKNQNQFGFRVSVSNDGKVIAEASGHADNSIKIFGLADSEEWSKDTDTDIKVECSSGSLTFRSISLLENGSTIYTEYYCDSTVQ